MRQKQKRDKRLNVVRTMPPLKKRAAGETYLFDLCKRIEYITYNPETGEWKGADV